MKRTIGLAVCLLLIAAETDDKGKKTEDPLLGSWSIESLTINGKSGPVVKGMSYKFTGDKMTLKGPQGERAQTYKIDPSQKPATIDMTAQEGPAKGKSVQGIFEVKGDELKMCFPAIPDGPRPKEFASAEGSKTVLISLKREKADKP
jgi:uncharacterized protein (TIGR03067 family)